MFRQHVGQPSGRKAIFDELAVVPDVQADAVKASSRRGSNAVLDRVMAVQAEMAEHQVGAIKFVRLLHTQCLVDPAASNDVGARCLGYRAVSQERIAAKWLLSCQNVDIVSWLPKIQ